MQTFIHGGGRLPEAVDAALAHYRHQIFVGQLGWQLPMADGRFERDQYDRDDTVYVVARDADGAICGCARLLPTTRPYLLKDVFAPLLMRGVPAPESPGVWELALRGAFRRVPRAGRATGLGRAADARFRGAMRGAARSTATDRRDLCQHGPAVPPHWRAGPSCRPGALHRRPAGRGVLDRHRRVDLCRAGHPGRARRAGSGIAVGSAHAGVQLEVPWM